MAIEVQKANFPAKFFHIIRIRSFVETGSLSRILYMLEVTLRSARFLTTNHMFTTDVKVYLLSKVLNGHGMPFEETTE